MKVATEVKLDVAKIEEKEREEDKNEEVKGIEEKKDGEKEKVESKDEVNNNQVEDYNYYEKEMKVLKKYIKDMSNVTHFNI